MLLYHVVSGKVKAADVVTLDEAEMVQAEKVSITVDSETVQELLLSQVGVQDTLCHVTLTGIEQQTYLSS